MAGKKKTRAKASKTHKSRIEAVINRALQPAPRSSFQVKARAIQRSLDKTEARIDRALAPRSSESRVKARATSALSKGIDRAIKIKPKKKRSTLSALRTASAKRRARKAQKRK